MKTRSDFEDFLNQFHTIGAETYPPEIDDLFSIYSYIRQNRVVSVLEFGCGWSTLVIAEALKENFSLYSEELVREVRHPNPFQLLSVDTSQYFIGIAKERLPQDLKSFVQFHFSNCQMALIKDQIAHIYSDIPPWTADLVYLDGPDCDHVMGDLNGFTVNFGDQYKPYGLPMSGDLIRLEPYFWPGSRIITDGRGANANFLKNNFVRNWSHYYDAKTDQHHFELLEEPWGSISRKLMQFKGQIAKS